MILIDSTRTSYASHFGRRESEISNSPRIDLLRLHFLFPYPKFIKRDSVLHLKLLLTTRNTSTTGESYKHDFTIGKKNYKRVYTRLAEKENCISDSQQQAGLHQSDVSTQKAIQWDARN